MANEISVTADLVFRKGSRIGGSSEGELPMTMTGTNTLENVQTVGTSEEALLMGDVPAGGWCKLRNLDNSNYVRVKAASGATAFGRMRPGEPCIFRIDSGATIYLQADTAPCEVAVVLTED